jgi:translation initiation factor 4G
MPSLDDDSIDCPLAYRTIATLMRTLSLSDENIEALVGMMEVYGDPKVTPRTKFDRAMAQVDEEAAKQ